jgi:hypothetical protein
MWRGAVLTQVLVIGIVDTCAVAQTPTLLRFEKMKSRFAISGVSAAVESSAAVAGQSSRMAPDARVRGGSPRIAALIIEAAAHSDTFRRLIDQIGKTDGIVLIREGRCGLGVRACLLHAMTIAGPNRMLFILVDARASDYDLMGSIGHELQHAVEVLSNRQVRTGRAMLLLFKRICNFCGGQFETDAAIKAGDAVRAELRNSNAAASYE